MANRAADGSFGTSHLSVDTGSGIGAGALLRRARSAPAALIIPALAAGLIFIIAVITSQVAIGIAERGQRAVIERLGDVYLDGLSALTLPYIQSGDTGGLGAALGRMKTYHEGIRDLRIVVRRPDGTLLAETIREGSRPTSPPAVDSPRDDLNRLENGRYWIQRPLTVEGREAVVLSAELDASDVLVEREHTRVVVLGIDVALSLLLAFIGYGVVRAVLRPVARLEAALLEANAGRLAPIPESDLPSEGNEFGRLLRAYNSMVDAVDERERLRERLGDQQRVADLGRLAATVAHEVRNPVAGMLSAVDTARRFGHDPAAVGTSLDLVERGLRNIGEVVDATLSIYRPGSGTRDLVPEDLEDLRLLAAPAARRRGIELAWDVALARPFAVDAGPLRQILLNLLLNAAGATPRGGTVTLVVREEEEALLVVVADGGSGMPEDVRQRMADGADGGEAGGGLGVDVVVRLLRALEGNIDVVTVPGTGSRITLRIPSRTQATAADG
jgi:two-component system, OmpR family, sensor kinase